jgi:hypothetical protein
MPKVLKYSFAILLFGVLFISCKKENPSRANVNIPPKTFLWLHADTSAVLSPQVSRQLMHWWGEDPDGLIRGYLFAFFKTDSVVAGEVLDTLSYSWVVKNDSLIAFPLLSARERFTIIVKAVDNSLEEQLSVGAIIRLNPEPYWDKNLNGLLDAEDQKLPGLIGAMDPVGAKQIFPIKNTPPVVEFATDALDVTKTIQQPETTFTVATFSWTGSDLDGDNTIKNYRICLNNPNDTTAWFEFTASNLNTMITLQVPRSRSDDAIGAVDADVYNGIFPTMRKLGAVSGLKINDTNRIYLQAKDVAGEYSPVVTLPSGKSLTFPTKDRIWYVRKPTSRLLTVVNYGSSDLYSVISFYQSAFAAIDTIPGVGSPKNFGNFDILDIRRGATGSSVGSLVPPILNPAFVLTLKLYDFVFWFTDYIPDTWVHVHAIAQFPLYLYSGSGGKVLYSTTFGYYLGDPRGSLVDFAPVDSVGSALIDTRVPNDWPIVPNYTLTPTPFPALRFSPKPTQGGQHSLFVRNFYKREGAEYLYSIFVTNRGWTDSVHIGVIDVDRRFVFLSMPLHLMNGYLPVWPDKPPGNGQGVPMFLKRVFIDEFGG